MASSEGLKNSIKKNIESIVNIGIVETVTIQEIAIQEKDMNQTTDAIPEDSKMAGFLKEQKTGIRTVTGKQTNLASVRDMMQTRGKNPENLVTADFFEQSKTSPNKNLRKNMNPEKNQERNQKKNTKTGKKTRNIRNLKSLKSMTRKRNMIRTKMRMKVKVKTIDVMVITVTRDNVTTVMITDNQPRPRSNYAGRLHLA
jgi:hypothetical protein